MNSNNCGYRILMIAPTPFFADRGCHMQIYEEIKALKKLGCEIVLCTYHIGRDMPEVKIFRSIKIPWYNKLSAGPSFHKIYIDFLLFLTSLKVALRFKPDIIHGHLHEGAFIGWLVKIFIRKPLLFDLQDSLSKEMISYNKKKALFVYPFAFLIEKFINKRANVIVTQSTEMIHDLKTRFNIKEKRLYLTMDGADVERFKPDINVEELRKKLGIDKNKKVIVYLGGLTNNKGVHYIIQSIPYVVKKEKDVLFLIMGYPNVEMYKEMAEKLEVLKYTLFTGQIDYNLAHLYLNLGDIALSPKYTETEANGKLYNYMACGLPVVAFDTVTDREILGDYGIYAKKGDVKDYADKTLYLLKNKKERERLGKKLRGRVVENYSWDKVGERIHKVYEQILQKSEK